MHPYRREGSGPPDGVFKMNEISCFATEGFCLRNIFMLSIVEFLNGNDHDRASLMNEHGAETGYRVKILSVSLWRQPVHVRR